MFCFCPVQALAISGSEHITLEYSLFAYTVKTKHSDKTSLLFEAKGAAWFLAQIEWHSLAIQ